MTGQRAAFAAAATIGVTRILPGWRMFAMVIAGVWVISVAFSRLVLGVHWPTDVLAADCIGAFCLWQQLLRLNCGR